uniref:Uncharacterized protein n=1 Tax=Solanum tuberosum TaxID=4113 RepID=M1D486_SOLTU
MEARYFYFTVHSARDLIDVRHSGEMKVYAKVSIAGSSKNNDYIIMTPSPIFLV